jgi:hypothetical protein
MDNVCQFLQQFGKKLGKSNIGFKAAGISYAQNEN